MELAVGEEPEDDPAGAIIDWLMLPATRGGTTDALIEELCARLLAAGISLGRLALSIGTLHPQIISSAWIWSRQTGRARQVDQGHDILNREAYLRSPLRAIHAGAPMVRQRLAGPGPDNDYPVAAEFREQGMTDYLALPLEFGSGTIEVFSVAADGPGGLSDADIGVLCAIRPALSTVVEMHNARRVSRTLLDTYLGHRSGAMVLDGRITRGSGETLHAVVWYSDLRGFTPMSDNLPRNELIEVLNDWFGCMIGAVEENGGEVLKLVGDAVLAIFPLEDAAFRHYVCNRALDTANLARRRMAEVNARREEAGRATLGFGIALHTGDVIWGNIGSGNRLDFTVIGPAVNHVTRIEGLCKETGRNLLVSGTFAATCERPLEEVGTFRLRGVEDPRTVYAPPGNGTPVKAAPGK